MKPILPRPLLWTEVQSMDRFLNEDFAITGIYTVIANLKDIFISSKLDVIKLFNEMYYQMTRIYYEKPLPAEYTKYVNDIKANMGWSYSADLVMAMIFTYIRIKDKRPDVEIKIFLEHIAKEQAASPFFIQFAQIKSTVYKWPSTPLDPKVPHPVSPKELASIYIDWKGITHNFDYEMVKEILKLWNDYDDQKYVAQLMKSVMVVGASIPQIRKGNASVTKLLEDAIGYLQDRNLERTYMCAESVMNYGLNNNEEQIERLKKEKDALQGKIDELEKENQRLNTLLDKKRRSYGRDKKFTLGQIVDYCKSKVQWDDVKDIVAMLNRLLRKSSTQEDSDLVDSIEEEFIKRRNGDSVSGNKNTVGDNSNMVNLVLPPNVDYDKLFNVIPPEIKELWGKQLTQKDNG